jgi:hypothetical protein
MSRSKETPDVRANGATGARVRSTRWLLARFGKGKGEAHGQCKACARAVQRRVGATLSECRKRLLCIYTLLACAHWIAGKYYESASKRRASAASTAAAVVVRGLASGGA